MRLYIHVYMYNQFCIYSHTSLLNLQSSSCSNRQPLSLPLSRSAITSHAQLCLHTAVWLQLIFVALNRLVSKETKIVLNIVRLSVTLRLKYNGCVQRRRSSHLVNLLRQFHQQCVNYKRHCQFSLISKTNFYTPLTIYKLVLYINIACT